MTPLVNAPRIWPGEGSRCVLLVHGLGGGPYELQWLGDAVHARLGASVESIRLAGHGPGPSRMPHSTWHAWLRDVEAAFRRLERSFARVDVVAFSTGCPLALALVAAGAGTTRLALLSPLVRVYRPAWMPCATETLLAALPCVTRIPRRAPPLRDPALREAVTRVNSFSRFSMVAARSATALVARVMPRLHAVGAPTLLIQARGDSVVDPSGAERLGRDLPAAAPIVWLDDSDHLVCLDRQKERVFDAVCAHLAGAAT